MSTDLRRDAGLLCSALIAVHIVASLGNHFVGRTFTYFVVDGFVRKDRFGLMIWVGVAATGIALVLAGTSNDKSVRRFRRRWKSLQRLVHLLLAASVAHTVLAAQLLGRSTWILFAPLIVCAVIYAVRIVDSRSS